MAGNGIRAELEHLRVAVAGEVSELEADLRAVFEASRDSNADDEPTPRKARSPTSGRSSPPFSPRPAADSRS